MNIEIRLIRAKVFNWDLEWGLSQKGGGQVLEQYDSLQSGNIVLFECSSINRYLSQVTCQWLS